MRTILIAKMASALLVVGFGIVTTQAAFIPVGRTNYFQNFDSLASSGKSKILPSGWSMFYPDDSDISCYADNGSGTMSRFYSYGANGSNERALGVLGDSSQSQRPTFGASFQNASGSAMNRLNISYTGEEWRLGAAGRGQDRLQFQYSLNASSLTSGTWINAPGLDFLTPNLVGVGAHNGNLAANQTLLSGSIGFLNIQPGSTFWVRWVDVAVPGGGPEDGLAVDNFSISAVPETTTLVAGVGTTVLAAFMFWRQRRSPVAPDLTV